MKVRELLDKVQAPYLKPQVTSFRPGDTLKVHVKVVEGESERIQPFEGIVIKRRGSKLSETFTVRKISFGIGVERTFPTHSPRIEKIEVMKSGKVKRARLYYLRKLSGKAARLSEKEEGKMREQEPSAIGEKNSSPTASKQTVSPEPAVSI